MSRPTGSPPSCSRIWACSRPDCGNGRGIPHCGRRHQHREPRSGTFARSTAATLVCKRGPLGASAFAGTIPATIDEGETGESFQVEVFNVLGAGDGFMAGLLKGWLTGQDWPNSIRIANACGAFAVSRHGCTPSYPSEAELDYFFETGVKTPALRTDAALEQVHWATNRNLDWPVLRVFAFDHRSQFEELCRESGAALDRVGKFKQLCLESAVSRLGRAERIRCSVRWPAWS